MSQTYPEWHPHDHPEYDRILTTACAAEFERLKSSTTSERLSFLCDTREAHQRIYRDLAPPDYPEYAGKYRGTSGTSLALRNVAARRIGDDDQTYFAPHQDVERLMGTIKSFIATGFGKWSTPGEVIQFATRAFLSFGYIHPFLDGNGHMQRLMFATIIFESKSLTLLPSWTIHPRPFDEEFALALEDPDTKQRSLRVGLLLKKHAV